MQSTKSLEPAILALFIITLVIFSGCAGTAPPINHPPTIISLTANTQSPIEVNQSTVITCLVTDQDGDTLTYTWTKTGGTITITGSGSTITWIAPNTPDTYTVTCTVSDGELSATQDFIITVSPSTNISPEAENFIGEWKAINPTRLSKVEIYSFGNNIYIHIWQKGDPNHPEDYDWGEQNFKISDLFNGVIKLHWEYFSNSSYDQEMEVLNNGVLKVRSTVTYNDQDVSSSYTDYFYNPEDENSYIPSLPGVGLYQDDPEFINVVNALDSPKKICQYMEDNFNYKVLWGPHSPYQTYLSKKGDCGDHAVFASAIANFHGYECFYILMYWTSDMCHAITVYNMGGYYTYSSNYLYFDQYFNSIEECVNHCASTYIGYIEGNLSSYETYSWDYYNYRTSHLF